jgi:ABC-type uncharacterized transport system permease subunit
MTGRTTQSPQTVNATGAVREIAPERFETQRSPIQKFHDADARLLLAVGVLAVFLIVFGLDAYACLGKEFCKTSNDVRDTFEPFAASVFTAFGIACSYFFKQDR